jgi:hypothetical protein
LRLPSHFDHFSKLENGQKNEEFQCISFNFFQACQRQSMLVKRSQRQSTLFNRSQPQSTKVTEREATMVKRNGRDLRMITLQKAADFYLATLETEGKSPRNLDWLKTRLRYFNQYPQEQSGNDSKLQDLTIENGWDSSAHVTGGGFAIYPNNPAYTASRGCAWGELQHS